MLLLLVLVGRKGSNKKKSLNERRTINVKVVGSRVAVSLLTLYTALTLAVEGEGIEAVVRAAYESRLAAVSLVARATDIPPAPSLSISISY